RAAVRRWDWTSAGSNPGALSTLSSSTRTLPVAPCARSATPAAATRTWPGCSTRPHRRTLPRCGWPAVPWRAVPLPECAAPRGHCASATGGALWRASSASVYSGPTLCWSWGVAGRSQSLVLRCPLLVGLSGCGWPDPPERRPDPSSEQSTATAESAAVCSSGSTGLAEPLELPVVAETCSAPCAEDTLPGPDR